MGLEKVTQQDLDDLEACGKERIKRTYAKPLTEDEIEQNRKRAAEIVTEIQAHVEQRDAELARIDPQLRPDVIAERTVAVRRRHQGRIDSLLEEAGRISEEVSKDSSSREWWSRPAVMMRATFHDDPATNSTIALATMQKVKLLPDRDLLTAAKQALVNKDIAFAAALDAELNTRPSLNRQLRDDIRDLIGGISTDAERLAPLLDELATAGYRATVAARGKGVSQARIALGLAKLRTAR